MADSLSSILSLIQSFSPKTTTETTSSGGGTSTKQTVLSQETMNAMLKSALEGSSGLAATVSGQNASGLYNSTTNTMLTNDLLSRLSTQVAVAGAPTTTTTPASTSTTTKVAAPATSGTSALATGAATLGLSAAKPLLDKMLGAKKTLDTVSSTGNAESIADAFGETNAPVADYLASTVAPAAEAVTVQGAESIADMAGETSAGIVSDALSTAGEDVAGEVVNSVVGDATSSAASEAGGGIISGITNLVNKCFLTTAVCEYQGKPDDCYELETLRHFRDTWMQEHSPRDIETYRRRAPDLVAKIKEHSDANKIFNKMYTDYIVPAIVAIEKDQPNRAYHIYKELFQFCVEV